MFLWLQQNPSPAAATGSQRLRPTAGSITAFLHSCYHGQSSLNWTLLVTGLAVSGRSTSSRHQEHIILCIFHINRQDKEQTLLAWERSIRYTNEHFPSFAKLLTIGATSVATHSHIGLDNRKKSHSSFWKQGMGIITHSVTRAFTKFFSHLKVKAIS